MLLAKGRREYEEAYKSYSFQRSTFGLEPLNFDLQTLFTTYNSVALAGYATRVAEELKAGTQSNRMRPGEADEILVNFLNEGKAELKEKFGYSESDIATPSLKWETFCVALRWKEKYLEYALVDTNELIPFMVSIVNQATGQVLAAMRDAFVQIYNSKRMEKFATKKRAETEATNDFLFGYCLKLSESIYAQFPTAPSP